MIQQLMVVLQEIVAEAGQEVMANPWRMVAEVVQFVLLVGIVWIVAIGTRKRKGFIANMLTEREEHVRTRLEEASHAEQQLATSRRMASLKLRQANAEARKLVSGAQHEAEQMLAQASKDADTEAERVISRAESALDTERAEMELGIREELVDLVAQATRSIMSERVSLAEQRRLIEGAIVESVKSSPAEPKPKPRTTVKRRPRSLLSGAGEES